MESLSFPSPNEMGKLKIKEVLHNNAVAFVDAGIKPDMITHHLLRDALAREYSRRLRLDILAYPQQRIRKYIGHKKFLHLSWRQLEKIHNRLKRGRRGTKKVRRKRRRRRKTRKVSGSKAP